MHVAALKNCTVKVRDKQEETTQERQFYHLNLHTLIDGEAFGFGPPLL